MIISCAIFMFILYFISSGILGDRGVLKMMYLLNNKSDKIMEYNLLEEKKNALSNRVNGLKDDNLDLDLLDERVRDNLGYIGEDEFVVYY